MRILALTALSIVGLVATGCATGSPPSPVEAAVASAPSPTPGLDWHFSAEPDEARLAYGMEASEEVHLGLSCGKGSGRLDLFALMPPGATREFHLESGGDTERYPAAAEPSDIQGDDFLTGAASASDPVFQRFRRLGWIAVWQDDERRPLVVQPTSAGGIERFFAYCG